MSEAHDRLLKTLGCNFSQPEFLEQALTHRSASACNNERLEFLGDAVLGMVIAHALYQKFPDATEGELSRLRSSLVKKPTLAAIARELKLGDYLNLGSGELKSGGYRRDSILADALEAIMGAVYLDGGFSASEVLILRLFSSRLDDIPAAAALKDPKTRLQEFLQSRQIALPAYEVIAITGQAHDQTFDVECRIAEANETTIGRGNSRRKAEQQAAEAMLARLDPKTESN